MVMLVVNVCSWSQPCVQTHPQCNQLAVLLFTAFWLLHRWQWPGSPRNQPLQNSKQMTETVAVYKYPVQTGIVEQTSQAPPTSSL